MSDWIHVYPVRKKKSDHITKKHGDCWCNPEVKQVCSESDEEGNCESGCFKCGGSGTVEPYDEDLNYLVIHKEHQLSDYEKD